MNQIPYLIGYALSAATCLKYGKKQEYAGEEHVLVPKRWLKELSRIAEAAEAQQNEEKA